MALIRINDAAKLSTKDREMKIKELELELMKAYVPSHKATAKTKEIKRALARLHTLNKSSKGALGSK